MSVLIKRPYFNFCVTIIRSQIKPTSRIIRSNYCKCIQQTNSLVKYNSFNFNFIRSKSKKSAKKKEESVSDESEEETEDFENLIVDKNTKIITTKVVSLRVDVVLKSGLSIARNKVEELFYMSKIRVNGKKVLKKSELVEQGDEIDVIKDYNDETKFLTVARVEVLDVKLKNEGFGVRLRRCKNLIIENYEEAWKPSD